MVYRSKRFNRGLKAEEMSTLNDFGEKQIPNSYKGKLPASSPSPY